MVTTTCDLAPYNTLHVSAFAERIVEISSLSQIKDEIAAGTFQKPFLILGKGANVLFAKDFPGTVIINKTTGWAISRETDTDVYITAASGQSWIDLVSETTAKGLSGMENMAFIPGTVGAAVVGNIAAYGQNQEDFFESAIAIDLHTGKEKTFSKSDCQFAYRESIFKHELKNQYFISSVAYRLSKTPKFNFSYSDIRKKDSILSELDTFANQPFAPADVARAVTQIRMRKLPHWDQVGTAGSFFKNPVLSKSQVSTLKSQISDLQTYPVDDSSEKIPAARLIDELGWRGKQIGNVSTAENQALCIINLGGATGAEIFAYSESIREDVKKNYGIELEYEVIVI